MQGFCSNKAFVLAEEGETNVKAVWETERCQGEPGRRELSSVNNTWGEEEGPGPRGFAA